MIGLVLQGGGAKGGYHIGVWKALREMNIEIGGVTGTSVGALNGALIVQNKYEIAHNLWHNLDTGMIIKDDPEIYHQLVTKNLEIKNTQMYLDYIKKLISQKGLDIEPLIKLIDKEIDETRIRDSQIDFGLVTVSLTDWKPIEVFIEDIENGKIGDYLLASSFLPGFKPQSIDGKRYLDGGFYDNLPINLIANKGYDEIIAVELNAFGRVQSIKDKSLSIRRIVPSGDLGSLLEFDKKRSRMNIEMGYLDTLKSFEKLEGKAYFLTNVPVESVFYKNFLELTDEQILTMAHIIGYKKGYPRRLLSEVILVELCVMLDFSLEMSYKDIMIGVLEFLAEIFSIERLKIYSFESFYKDILEKCRKAPLKVFELEYMPSILRRQSIIQKTFKVELLMKWLQMMSKEDS